MQFDDQAYQPRHNVPIVRRRWKTLLVHEDWTDIQREHMGKQWKSHTWRISYPWNMKMNADYFLAQGVPDNAADYKHLELQINANAWWQHRRRLYRPNEVRWISAAMTYKYKRPRIIIYICFHRKLTFRQAYLYALRYGPVNHSSRPRVRAIYGGPIPTLNYQTDPKGTKLLRWWSRGTLSRGHQPLH